MSFFPIGECCTRGSILPGTPKGTIQSEGLSVPRYYARPAEILHPNTCLVLLYDVFGFSIPNPKLLADTYASRLGIEVYVPDYIPNPAPDSLLSPAIEFYPGQHANQSWFSWIAAKLNMLRLIPYLPGIFGCIPLVDKALADLKGYETIIAVGYCRGGTMVSHVLSQENCPVAAGVLFHPEWKPDEFAKFSKPSTLLLAEKDQYISPDKVEQLKKIVANKQSSVKVYPGTVHGFAARPAFEYEPTMKAFHAANEDAAVFLQKHVGS